MSGTQQKQKKPRDRSLPPEPEPLPHPVIDNHCHLGLANGEALTVDEALSRAAGVGVTRIVQIGCHMPSAREAVQMAADYDQIVAGVALHPNDAARHVEAGDFEEAWAEIERLAGAHDKVRAVGETGLDFFRTGEAGHAAQEESFRRHIALAKRLDKTLVIHDRDAHDDVLRVVLDEGAPQRWVMHCFSGDAEFARRCLDAGAHLSFAGTVTYKSADDLREAARVAPRDRVLVETDAPYLPPEPYRGRPNASYLIPLTMRVLAQTRGEDLADLCAAVEANTFAAFGGPW